jgi:hypothetical protein
LAYVVPKGIPHSEFLGWDPLDQDKALAWEAEQRTVCTGCGTRKSEWDKDRFAYVGQQHYCPGCDVLAQEQENVREGAHGFSVGLVPFDQATPPDERYDP